MHRYDAQSPDVCTHRHMHSVTGTLTTGGRSRTVESFSTFCSTMRKESVLEEPGGPTMISGMRNWMHAMIANTFSCGRRKRVGQSNDTPQAQLKAIEGGWVQ